MSSNTQSRLDTLNAANFLKIRSCQDLEQNKKFKVLSIETKKINNAKKLMCTLLESEERDGDGEVVKEAEKFVVFLASSYCESKKFSSLESLLKEKKNVYIELLGVQNTNSMILPNWKFSSD
jgi:hypothetical protein